ncbi:MAG: homoserine dehydrogenase [Candidatus Kapabacteria bacterium]|nr:homoserine dehydrogenase [Candidatus Kapabacteria bacterium]
MKKKELVVGVFGFGCVGQGLYEVLEKTPGFKTTIKKICVKDRNKRRSLDDSMYTFEKDDILNDPEINVVIELIDDSEAAFEIVSQALNNKKAVVSANKKMIAENFQALLELQRINEVPLLYEAACCASIPIIRNLEEYYDNDLLESIEGIVNGSTNYILTKTDSDNLTYSEALQLAQSLGYAESNPSLDTEGYDAKFKLLILIAHAFGILVKPTDIFNIGINLIGDLEIQYAKEKGYKIKLVANAYKTSEGKVACYVLPKFVRAESNLYSVKDAYNGIITKTSFADTQFFLGKGAGAHPTASAVLSDLSALSYNYQYEYKKILQNENLELDTDCVIDVMFRHSSKESEEVLPYFHSIDEIYKNQEHGYITGTINLQNLKNYKDQFPDSGSFIQLTN